MPCTPAHTSPWLQSALLLLLHLSKQWVFTSALLHSRLCRTAVRNSSRYYSTVAGAKGSARQKVKLLAFHGCQVCEQ